MQRTFTFTYDYKKFFGLRILIRDVNDVIAHTPLHISRHLEFIVEQGHRVNWVSGSLDSRVPGSLGPSSMSASSASEVRIVFLANQRSMRNVPVVATASRSDIVASK